MKRIVLATLVALVPLALAAQNNHMKFVQNGAFASIDANPDQFSSIHLDVARGTTSTGGTNTNITFFGSSFSPDFSVLTITNIIGQIPDSDFTGDNTKDLALNLDTSQLDPTTSSSETCTIDLSTFTIVCGPAAAGTIQLAFHENGVQSTRVVNSVTITEVGLAQTNVHQRAASSSANVQGTIFGTPISTPGAQVGVNHQSTLEFTRSPGGM